MSAGVAGTTLDDVKVAAEVSGSQMYHYFPDKDDLVQAVIDYQAEAIVTRNRAALSSPNGVEAWRKMVMTAAKRTKAKGGCQLARCWSTGRAIPGGPSTHRGQASISGQPPSAMDSGPSMLKGSSVGIDPDDLAIPCSPRSKGAILAQVQQNPRLFETAIDTLLALIIGE